MIRYIALLTLLLLQSAFTAYLDPADGEINSFRSDFTRRFDSLLQRQSTALARSALITALKDSKLIQDNLSILVSDKVTFAQKTQLSTNPRKLKEITDTLKALSGKFQPVAILSAAGQSLDDKISASQEHVNMALESLNSIKTSLALPSFAAMDLVCFASLQDTLKAVRSYAKIIQDSMTSLKAAVQSYQARVAEREARFNRMRADLAALKNVRSGLSSKTLYSKRFRETTFEEDGSAVTSPEQAFQFNFPDKTFHYEWKETAEPAVTVSTEQVVYTINYQGVHSCETKTVGTTYSPSSGNPATHITDSGDLSESEFARNFVSIFSLSFCDRFTALPEERFNIEYIAEGRDIHYRVRDFGIDLIYPTTQGSLPASISLPGSGYVLRAEMVFDNSGGITFIRKVTVTNSADKMMNFIWEIPASEATF